METGVATFVCEKCHETKEEVLPRGGAPPIFCSKCRLGHLVQYTTMVEKQEEEDYLKKRREMSFEKRIEKLEIEIFQLRKKIGRIMNSPQSPFDP